MGVNVEGVMVSQATGPNNGRVTFLVARAQSVAKLLFFAYSDERRQQKTRTHTRIQAAFQLFSMISDAEFDVALVLATAIS